MANMIDAWHLEPTAEQQRLVRTQLPTPTAGPGQVVVEVEGVSLNYRDLIHRRQVPKPGAVPRIPTSDGVGRIVQLGEGVHGWQLGDRVAGTFFQTWQQGPFEQGYHSFDLGGNVNGMLARQVLLSADGIVRIPNRLTSVQAATLPCAAVTAWVALFERAQLMAGQTLLVQGTGGVSLFGLQLAVAAGARVIVTSSRDDKLARASQLGATHTINYTTHPDWDRRVWELTDKLGVDHILEVGGAGTMARSMQSIRAAGTISLIGVLTGFGPLDASLFPLVSRNVNLNGIYVGSRAHFEHLLEFVETHQLVPVVDRVFEFDAAADAYDYLESGQHFGKVVIQLA